MKEVVCLIKKGDTIPGICTAVIGALTLLYIFTHPKMVVFGESRNGGIGPGFFPFICGAIMLILGVVLTLHGIRQNGTVDYFAMDAEKKGNFKLAGLLILMCILLLAAWKISKLFFICLPLYAFAVSKLLKRSTLFSIVFTIVMTGFVYLLFRVCFSITFRP